MAHHLKKSIVNLQQLVETKADGYWGAVSQEALECSGYLIDLDYDLIRQSLFNGSISDSQFKGLKRLVFQMNVVGKDAINPLHVACILSTSYHETDKKMMPIEEYGKGKGKPYGKLMGGHAYYGRGDVQLTWLRNYAAMGKKIGIDLVNHPELALDPAVSAQVIITGMLDGDFTGKKLSDYMRYGLNFEFINSRRVVNGTDDNKLIASYAYKFFNAIILVRRCY